MWFRANREKLWYSLNNLYGVIGLTKQAVWKHEQSEMRLEEMLSQVKLIVERVRTDHPGMGLRTIYEKMQPEGIGRDKFESLCLESSLGVGRRRNPRRTTDSRGVKRFDNLLEDVVITGSNQAFVSDITYFEISGRFYYLTFIEDLYSRYIKGHSVSSRLQTEFTTLTALKRAVRNKNIPEGIIFHSDGGGQYYSKEFLKLTEKKGFRNSMGKEACDNPHAERLNGTIKNQYLAYKKIGTLKELEREVDHAVQMYNRERPHRSLRKLTPLQVENGELTKLQRQEKTVKTTDCRGMPLQNTAKQKKPHLTR